jgi:pyridoxal 5'-phosphate synthase pdxS subunit
MIRTKGEAGTGNVVEAVRHVKTITAEISELTEGQIVKIEDYAKAERVSVELVQQVARDGKLPVVNFAAGGVATPADAAMMMQLGMEGVFVGSGIFKSGDPEKRAVAIVKAVTHYNDPEVLARVSEDLGEPMVGRTMEELEVKMAER